MIWALVVGLGAVWLISTGRLTAVLRSLTTDPAKAGSSFGFFGGGSTSGSGFGFGTGPCLDACDKCDQCHGANPGAYVNGIGADGRPDPCIDICKSCDDCSKANAQ